MDKKRLLTSLGTLVVSFIISYSVSQTLFIPDTLTINPSFKGKIMSGLLLVSNIKLSLPHLGSPKNRDDQPAPTTAPDLPNQPVPTGEYGLPPDESPDNPQPTHTVSKPLPTQTRTYPQPTTAPPPAGGTPQTLAQCLTQKGFTMYGIQGCSACQAQKNYFGSSFSLIHYVDCNTQGNICQQKQIRAYPTWEDATGEKYRGAMRLSTLANLSGCPAPS